MGCLGSVGLFHLNENQSYMCCMVCQTSTCQVPKTPSPVLWVRRNMEGEKCIVCKRERGLLFSLFARLAALWLLRVKEVMGLVMGLVVVVVVVVGFHSRSFPWPPSCLLLGAA